MGSWEGWNITWNEVERLEGVTSGSFDEKQTYTPEQSGYTFLVVRTTIENPTAETRETRFTADPVFVTDDQGQVYNLAGLQMDNTFMMAPPYLPSTDYVISQRVSWAGGAYAIAYEPVPETWYMGATAGVDFEIGFVFVVPVGASELVMRLEGGPAVNIQ